MILTFQIVTIILFIFVLWFLYPFFTSVLRHLYARILLSKTSFKKDLEKIRKHYVVQKPSYCGPATLAIILSFLGKRVDQENLAKLGATKVGSGTHPEDLIKVASDVTKGKLIGVWIDADKIGSFRKEVISWIADDGFVIVDFKKKFVFPTAKTAHYSICASVFGNDLLLIDPNGNHGGVYLVRISRILRGMHTYSKLLKSKRGYIVFGYKGSKAYSRIKSGLIYLDHRFYHNTTNSLKRNLDDLRDRVSDDIYRFNQFMPETIARYIRTYKEKAKVKRIWKP